MQIVSIEFIVATGVWPIHWFVFIVCKKKKNINLRFIPSATYIGGNYCTRLCTTCFPRPQYKEFQHPLCVVTEPRGYCFGLALPGLFRGTETQRMAEEWQGTGGTHLSLGPPWSSLRCVSLTDETLLWGPHCPATSLLSFLSLSLSLHSVCKMKGITSCQLVYNFSGCTAFFTLWIPAAGPASLAGQVELMPVK